MNHTLFSELLIKYVIYGLYRLDLYNLHETIKILLYKL